MASRATVKQPKGKPQSAPIGVFDSGLGGLTVVRELLKSLPHEDIIYFGDLARLPYGIKSKRQIRKLSLENAELLSQYNVKAVVVACNSAAGAGLTHLKKHFSFPIIDVIRPAAFQAMKTSAKKNIAVLATPATVFNQAYEKVLKQMDAKIVVKSVACPLFVPLVENGWLSGKITEAIVKEYLKNISSAKTDTIILGCTHYPLLKEIIAKEVGKKIQLIDSAEPTVSHLTQVLDKMNLLSDRKRSGDLKILVSDFPQNFITTGEQFLGSRFLKLRIVKVQD